MLGDTNAVATLAVKDLGKAARFYEETLGLSRAGAEDNEAIMFESGDTTINVYRSSFAGTNKATALTWAVDDVDDVVRTLKGKGVKFEHYDLPDTQARGGCARLWRHEGRLVQGSGRQHPQRSESLRNETGRPSMGGDPDFSCQQLCLSAIF